MFSVLCSRVSLFGRSIRTPQGDSGSPQLPPPIEGPPLSTEGNQAKVPKWPEPRPDGSRRASSPGKKPLGTMNLLHSASVVRCAIYTRTAAVESSEQSIRAQRAICEDIVTANSLGGWEASHYFCDIGESGATLQRPGLQALLQALGEGRVDVVIAPDLARISRSVPDLIAFLNTTAKHGARLVSATDSMHYRMPVVAVLLPVLVGLAQIEAGQHGNP